MDENKTENSSTNETSKEIEKQKEHEDNGEEEIINTLKNINNNSEDLLSLVNNLIHFCYKLNSLKNIGVMLTNEILDYLKKFTDKGNIKINLILGKIYMHIISNESLFTDYLMDINESKVNILIRLIEECISLIEKINGFVFDPDLFKFKTKTLSLIKCIYLNRKNEINNEIINKKLEDLLYNIPGQFFSETYNELNKEKDYFNILKSLDSEKLNNFEDRFAQINNYYEQLEAFQTFVLFNSGVVTYAQVAGEQNPDITEEEEKKDVDETTKNQFYEEYGILLLKFCKYHHYVFLNKEKKDEENKEKKNDEENEENIRVVFLLDKIKNEEVEKAENENKGENKIQEEKNVNESEQTISPKNNKKIENLLDDKLFISVTESNEYNDCIKKEINNYLNVTKEFENSPQIKAIRDQMTYYLNILGVESYVPLYLKNFSKITISDNFTPSFLVNVPAGKTTELYLETKLNETMLVFVEFSMEDKSKDINFEVNKYEIDTNSFKSIFKEEKIEDPFKFFILCNGYSLYQIRFDNYYSWFTSKDINYRISLLKLIDRPKKDLNKAHNEEEKKKEIEEEKKDDSKEDIKEDIKEEKHLEENKNEEKHSEEDKNEEKHEEENEEKENEKEKEKEKENEKEEEKKKGKEKEKEKGKEEEKEKESDKKEDNNDNNKEEEGDDKFYCYFNGKNSSFNSSDINKRIEEFEKKEENKEIINIPVIFYLNHLRIVSIKKGENGEEVIFNEKVEDDKIIPKHSFDYQIIKYLKKSLNLKKPKDAEKKRIIISMFSQNRELSSLSNEIEDKIKALNISTINNSINDNEYVNYLEKIGFYPSEIIEGYKVEYKLYDLCEQSLIYYLYLSNIKNIQNKKSILFIQFDKLVVNASVFNEGAIFSKLKGKKEKDVNWKSSYFNNININDTNSILDFLENANDTFEGIDLVLNYVDSDDENKNNKLKELFDAIKKHCQEKINPPVNVHIYNQNEITNNVFKYINCFYDN